MGKYVFFEEDDLNTYQDMNRQMLAYTERDDYLAFSKTDEFKEFYKYRLNFLAYFDDKYTDRTDYHVTSSSSPWHYFVCRIKEIFLPHSDILQTKILRRIQHNLRRHLIQGMKNKQ